MFEIKKLKTEQSWLKERQQIITASEMAFALANFCDDETTRLFYEDILNKVAAPGKAPASRTFGTLSRGNQNKSNGTRQSVRGNCRREGV